MHVSEAKLAANRLNAELSTGARTEEGQRRSSLNAIKHGLTGRTVLLPQEDPGAYQAFCRKIIDSLQAETPVEEELAQLIAEQYWRLRRIRTVEEAMNQRGEASLQEISNLGIYQNRINRVLKDAEQRLRESQTQRKAEEEARKEEAIRLYQFSKMNGLRWAPEDFGFRLLREGDGAGSGAPEAAQAGVGGGAVGL
jgi:hypothetical protein